MIRTFEDVTPAVLEVMRRTPDPRLSEIMTALVSHLHAFVVETKLTEPEFRVATAILAEMGRLTNETHQEFVLMAGALGVSQLVCLMNNGEDGTRETAQNLLGPFWRLNSPRVESSGSILRSDTPGEPMFVSARVVDTQGRPVAGAEVDVWHASPIGLYENQDQTQADMNLRGKLTTDAEGRFAFRSVKMVGYPIPTDGVVGRLLAAQDRHPMRPAHLHALIVKPGFKTLISQLYDSTDPHIDDDVAFGVTRATIGEFVRHEARHPTASDVAGPWWSLDHTYVLERGESALPKPPIK